MKHGPRSLRLTGFLCLLVWKQMAVTQPLKVTFVSPVHFYEKCVPYQGTVETSVRVTAWRGERISLALMLWSDGPGPGDIAIRLPELQSAGDTISSANTLLRRVDYVRADMESKPCGGHADRDPDHFIELGDILSDQVVPLLTPGCPEIFWLTIDLPETATPGLYEGEIEVWQHDQVTNQLELTVVLSDLRLPPVSEWRFHLDFWQYPAAVVDRYNKAQPGSEIAYWDADHFALLERMYRPLARMGQKVITAHIKEGALGSPSMIRWILRPDGSWEFDFTDFDNYVRAMTGWGISHQINCHSPIGWNSHQIPCWDMKGERMQITEASIGSEPYIRIWTHFLDAFRMHLLEQGWFKKTVLFLDEVEPELLEWTIDFIHAHDPAWKIGLAAFHVPPENVWAHLHDLSLMIGVEWPESRANPDKLTFYTSCNPPRPNHFIAGDADPYENLWVGWHASAGGYSGFLRWAYDYWIQADPADQQAGTFTSGDFSFLYRTSNNLDMRFHSSVRMELIREGIEDYEKILILKERLRDSDSERQRRLYATLAETLEALSWNAREPGEIKSMLEDARRLLDEITTSLK